MVWPFSGSKSAPAASAGEETWNTDPRNMPSAAGTSSSTSSSAAEGSATSYHLNSDAKFDASHSGGPSADFVAPSAAGLLSNPAFDAARLHPLAGLGKDEIEYLDIVDAQPSQLEGARTALPSRGWSDDLCYGTGTTYLSGLALGGLLGAREGLVRPLGVQSPTFRLRLNAVLNQVTRRGSFFGNSAGVVALIYNIADASIDAARGKHDLLGSVAAGGISGAVFKCTAGVRPMAISASIMMAAAASWTAAKQALL